MTLADIVHHHVLHPLGCQLTGQLLSHLLGVSVHAAINNHHPLVGIIATQTVVYANHLSDVLCPYRAVGRANHLDRQSAQLLEGFLHRSAILAHNVGIVAHHLVPIFVKVDLRVNRTTIHRAVGAEGISGDEHLLSSIVGHHHLRPVHHRRHVERQFMVSQVKGVTLLHHETLALNAIVAVNHTESLDVAHNRHFWIILLDEGNRTRMVGFHMVHYQVVDRFFA